MDANSEARSGSHRSRHKALSAGRCDGPLVLGAVNLDGIVTKPCQRAGVMDRICARAGEARQSQVTKPCQRAGVMDKVGDTTVIENPTRVTKPCQRAGVMDTTARSRPTPTARCHKALSAGRCDGPPCARPLVVRTRPLPLNGRTSHKALSAGRCDGRARHTPVVGTFTVTKPCQRAGVMDKPSLQSKIRLICHKALSAGRCDGHGLVRFCGTQDNRSQSPVSGQV